MSGERWAVDGKAGTYRDPLHLLWPDDQDPDIPHRFTESHMAEAWPDESDAIVEPAYAALVADVRAAARLRSLAAIYEQPLNRDTTFTFTGRELAAMLKEEG